MDLSKYIEITASEFDEAFENGDVIDYLDIESAKVRFPVAT